MQIAYRAKDIAEAHIVANLLQANGIEAFVGGHFLQGALGDIGMAEFANVQVNDDDFYPARAIINDYESQGLQRPNQEQNTNLASNLLNTSYVILGFLLLAVALTTLLDF